MSSSGELDQNEVLARAARTHLAPIGLKRKGRPRLWFKDNRWWLVVVEFQPSSWSKGSYLNVAAMWLWHAKDYWSFDEGGRIDGFRDFKSSQQFSQVAEQLTIAAGTEVVAIDKRFASVAAAASHLAAKDGENPWVMYHAAVAALATNDLRLAQAHFERLTRTEERAPWVSDVKARGARLFQSACSLREPRDAVTNEVQEARRLLKLAPVPLALLWEPR